MICLLLALSAPSAPVPVYREPAPGNLVPGTYRTEEYGKLRRFTLAPDGTWHESGWGRGTWSWNSRARRLTLRDIWHDCTRTYAFDPHALLGTVTWRDDHHTYPYTSVRDVTLTRLDP